MQRYWLATRINKQDKNLKNSKKQFKEQKNLNNNLRSNLSRKILEMMKISGENESLQASSNVNRQGSSHDKSRKIDKTKCSYDWAL